MVKDLQILIGRLRMRGQFPVQNSALPEAYVGRKFSKISDLTVRQARAYLGVEAKGAKAVLAILLLCFTPFTFFFGWLFLIFGIFGAVACTSVVGRWWKDYQRAKSGTIKRGPCPFCGTDLYLWAKGLDCPVCKHRLIEYQNHLYDMS